MSGRRLRTSVALFGREERPMKPLSLWLSVFALPVLLVSTALGGPLAEDSTSISGYTGTVSFNASDVLLVDLDYAVFEPGVYPDDGINGDLWEPEYIYTEIRNRKFDGNRRTVPLSVYMYFLKPSKFKGREVVYVEGQNKDKLLAYEGCSPVLRKLGAVPLKPENPLAMKGNRYPITEAGMENLMVKLMEKGQRDRKRGECDVQFMKGATINGRTCTVLQVTHPTPRPYFDFHIARIFIDDELSIPIRYAAYMWPSKPGGKPELLESYTYLNVKLNVGLTDDDFNHEKKFRM